MTSSRPIRIFPDVAEDAKWPIAGEDLVVKSFTVRMKELEDFFWIDDSDLESVDGIARRET